MNALQRRLCQTPSRCIGAWHKRLYKHRRCYPVVACRKIHNHHSARLTFCAGCALRTRSKILCFIHSWAFLGRFSLLASFYSSRVVVKTLVFPSTRSIWVALMAALRLVLHAILFPTGTETALAEVPL